MEFLDTPAVDVDGTAAAPAVEKEELFLGWMKVPMYHHHHHHHHHHQWQVVEDEVKVEGLSFFKLQTQDETW